VVDERVLQLRVGVVVVVSAVITCILIGFFSGMPDMWRKQYTIFVDFPDAPGVTVNTPVRKNGILVGRVTDVELEDGGVRVTAKMESKYPISRSEICRISSGSLFGDAVLEFVPGGKGRRDQVVGDGEYINETIVTKNPLQVFVNMEEQINEALGSVRDAGQEVSVLAESVNTVVSGNEDQLSRILTKSETALDRFNEAMGTVEEFLDDDELKQKLKKSLDDLPELLHESRELVAGLKKMSDDASANLENLKAFTGPLGQRGDEIVGNVERSTENLEELLGQLALLSKRLENPEGTVGQLINNPDLYQKLDRAASNIEEVTRQLRPIVEDARVFASKIARDPGRLGVKGALDRRKSGSKWFTEFDRVEYETPLRPLPGRLE